MMLTLIMQNYEYMFMFFVAIQTELRKQAF